MTSPLGGRSVVITRSARQNAPLRDMLSERGAEVIELPLIEIVEPDDDGVARDAALERAGEHDWIVVTSPNGAERAAPYLRDVSARTSVAVVGEATGRALGCEVSLTAEPAIADALAEQFPAGTGSVLLVQGNLADDTLRRALVDKGWTVTKVEAYRTVHRTADRESIERARTANIVLFASGSAVRAWRDVVGSEPRCSVAIGPSTAAAAREIGYSVAVVAEEHSLGGLVDAAERAAEHL
ncbi:MAG: uroporphyrinogen-III synthase [Ilumatobacteraceae bacterium]